MLDKVRIVLVGTTHPGNIGAAARAMKNMCLSQLVLVEPKLYPHAEATARASGAFDLLENAKVCSSLDEALEGCRLVVGSSARRRSIEWPELDPPACARKLLAEAAEAPVALMFGRENSGLSNEELDRCHYLVHIPTNPDYSSLNLAAAVQVLCYELLSTYRADEGGAPASADVREVASAEAMESFHRHLELALADIEFLNPQQSEKLMRRLRRFFHRARPDTDEVNIFRGILSAAQDAVRRRR